MNPLVTADAEFKFLGEPQYRSPSAVLWTVYRFFEFSLHTEIALGKITRERCLDSLYKEIIYKLLYIMTRLLFCRRATGKVIIIGLKYKIHNVSHGHYNFNVPYQYKEIRFFDDGYDLSLLHDRDRGPV